MGDTFSYVCVGVHYKLSKVTDTGMLDFEIFGFYNSLMVVPCKLWVTLYIEFTVFLVYRNDCHANAQPPHTYSLSLTCPPAPASEPEVVHQFPRPPTTPYALKQM